MLFASFCHYKYICLPFPTSIINKNHKTPKNTPNLKNVEKLATVSGDTHVFFLPDS